MAGADGVKEKVGGESRLCSLDFAFTLLRWEPLGALEQSREKIRLHFKSISPGESGWLSPLSI